MAVTLTNLIGLVNSELENAAMRGSSESEGDGETTAFLVPPPGRFVVSDATWAVYLDGVATTAFTMDFDSGVCTFTSAPATGVVISFVFNYVSWTDALVTQAINAAIHNLFPAFYVSTTYEITSDGSTSEYAMRGGPKNTDKTITSSSVANPTVIHCDAHGFATGTVVTVSEHSDSTPAIEGDYVVTSTGTDTFTIPVNVTVAGTGGTASRPVTVEFVTSIESRTSSDQPWALLKRAKRYELYWDEGVLTARFYNAPQQGSLRAHTICRPQTLTALADSIESVSGLPTRAKDVIVSFACYYLLSQKMAPRVRSDLGVETMGSGILLPSQMNYGAQGYMMRFQFQMASLKMNPWSLR